MVRDPARAEEIVQEVFLKVWRQPGSYLAERGPFGTWLLSVTHHRAIDVLRARRVDVVPLDDLESRVLEIADRAPDMAESASIREQRAAVREAMATLPVAQRRVLEMAYFGGLSQTEIADGLGEPLGTIKTRVRLAIQKLRTHLTPLLRPGDADRVNGSAAHRSEVRLADV
jgi:RNA polymerase sigma-70 factor (ECF subfamily)